MQALITNSLIPKLQPATKQYDIRDSRLTGFLIRVNPTGNMVYVCEYKRGRRINLGKVGVLTPAQARDMALNILNDAAKGIYPDEKKRRGITLKQFIENHYTPWAETHRKAGLNAVARIKRCFYDWLGNKPLSEITPAALDQWRTQRLKAGLNTETINRDIATFKAALSKAVLWEFLESHPLTNLKLFKVDTTAKVRYLSREEEARLRQALDDRETELRAARARYNEWRAARQLEILPDLSQQYFADDLKPKVLLSMNTGIRRGELISLQWSNVDLEKQFITIVGDVAKSGKSRHIPLNEEALGVLKNWRQQTISNDWVFTSPSAKQYDNWYKAWNNLLAKTNIENFRWHDLRHHFASKLVMASVDLNTVRELLGHSDLKMTLRYAHLAPEHKIQAVAKLIQKHKD